MLGEAVGAPMVAVSSEQLRAILQVPEEPPHRCLTDQIEDRSSIPWPKEIHAGGADILKRQSACAFQSFAVRRLGAEELDVAERALTPLDRGNLLHKVMEAFWSTPSLGGAALRTRDDLINAKASGRLPEILAYHIAEVFKREFAGATWEGKWSRAYLQVEQARMLSLVSRWLNYESGRTAFTVDENEKEVHAEINGLQLGLRVDRIDRVDGGRLILDYKTGTVSPSMWDGQRPDEPQLPLYGVHGPDADLRGVLFAQVRTRDMCLKGRVEEATKTVFKGLKGQSDLVKNPLTEDTLGEWADALSNLADQFLAGAAAVAPKHYPKTCKYCALPSLCRVAETLIEREIDDLEDGEDDSLVSWEIAAND
jgi:ATP-dependent helicase/DNAse subunit B